MEDEYNIQSLNPRKNPYASKEAHQITIGLDESTYTYFHELAEKHCVSCESLIEEYLHDCAINQRPLPKYHL